MNAQLMHWTKKQELKVRIHELWSFVSRVTMGKLLNEFCYLPTPVSFCKDQQEHGLRALQGQGQGWVQAGHRGRPRTW